MAARGPVHLPPPLHGELAVNDLSVVGDEMWAVGMHGAPAPALVGHSTGGTPWALVPYPGRSGAAHTQLAGVHARAHDDVWAVGWEGLFHTHTERAHIAHHDGTTWRSIQSPDHGDGSHLAGVAAWARDDALAVGSRTSHPSLPIAPLGPFQNAAWDTVTARWDGSTWGDVPSPGPGTLTDVCAVGPGEYWAVGTAGTADRPGNVPLVGHYADGHWQQVSHHGIGTLFAVAANGPDDVWAVGQDQDPGHAGGALIVHYDGTVWTASHAPMGGGQAWLSDVACAGHDMAWAVGTQQRADGTLAPLILRFDGAWAAVDPPPTAAPLGLSAVVALPDGTAWAAGGFSAAGDTGYPVPWS